MESFVPAPEVWTQFMEDLETAVGPGFVAASNHLAACRCGLCLQWWAQMGNEEEGYGPFSEEEIGVAGEVSDAQQCT